MDVWRPVVGVTVVHKDLLAGFDGGVYLKLKSGRDANVGVGSSMPYEFIGVAKLGEVSIVCDGGGAINGIVLSMIETLQEIGAVVPRGCVDSSATVTTKSSTFF